MALGLDLLFYSNSFFFAVISRYRVVKGKFSLLLTTVLLQIAAFFLGSRELRWRGDAESVTPKPTVLICIMKETIKNRIFVCLLPF